jgi:antirestriction protein ArdC/type IV secretory pathway ATPase VirB11/archaellum biosynthesis ATPase
VLGMEWLTQFINQILDYKLMKSIQKFNGLNGAQVSREEILRIIDLANKEEQYQISDRLGRILLLNPDDEKFNIDIVFPATEIPQVSMLNGFINFEENIENGLNKPVPPAEIYQMITDKVVNMVKKANAKDYKRKWEVKGYMIPFNFVSKKRYRGVNHLMLTELEIIENPFFLTFDQVNKLGGKVKKGSHGYEVIYFTNIYEIRDNDKEIRFSSFDLSKVKQFASKNGVSTDAIVKFPLLKYYNVFNGKDIEGIDFDLDNFKIGYTENDVIANEKNRLDIPEAIIKNYPKTQPKIQFGGQKAYYSSHEDLVNLPVIEKFATIQDYYRTMFHELSHSTGHHTRLDRKLGNEFGSKDYAFEELVAELGSIFLNSEAGIKWHTNKNHAAYLKGWNNALTAMENDTKFVMKAATQAQKIADFVLQFNSDGNPLYLKDLKKKSIKTKVAKKNIDQPQTKKVSQVKSKSTVLDKDKKTDIIKPKTTVVRGKKDVQESTVKVDETTRQISLFGAKKQPKKTIKKPVKKALRNPIANVVQNIVTAAVLGEPDTEKVTEVKPKLTDVPKNSLAYRMQNKGNEVREYYDIPNKDISDFFGKIEKKIKESVAITITGGQGSMKTRLCFQIMNALAQNYKVGHASIEEHPESGLYEDKIHQYLNAKALTNISAPEVSTIDDVHKLVRENDVIIIDSFSKLQEMQKGVELDKDFRKAYNGKLFIIIYQQTTDGKMRGGSKSQFDGDIICFVKKETDYKENYCYQDKNRYQKTNLEDLKFNIFSGKLLKKETDQVQPIVETQIIAPISNHQFNFKVS